MTIPVMMVVRRRGGEVPLLYRTTVENTSWVELMLQHLGLRIDLEKFSGNLLYQDGGDDNLLADGGTATDAKAQAYTPNLTSVGRVRDFFLTR